MQRAVRPQWWDDGVHGSEPVRALLARHDIGALFGFLKTHGFSWSAIASATGLGASRVSEIAAGRRIVTDYAVLERIAEGLLIPRHYMGLGFDDVSRSHRVPPNPPDRGAGEDQRELLGAIAGIAVGAIPMDLRRWLPVHEPGGEPDTITADDIATVEAVTDLHRRLDAGAGGGTCLQSISGYANWAHRLLNAAGASSDTVVSGMQAALADLHNLVGWVAHDLDRHELAQRHLVQSLVLARQSDALPLLANTLYRLGRVSIQQGRPAEALHLLGLGQLAAEQAGCPAAAAILHANTAWAYAIAGADRQALDSLARARAEHDRVNPDTAPTWTRFALAEADVHGISAVVCTALARHPEHRTYADAATEHSLEAIRLRRPEDRRSFIFDTISAATASTLAGDIDTAQRYAANAVALVEDGMRSARVNDRLADLWRLAQPHAERHPELEELGRRIARLPVG